MNQDHWLKLSRNKHNAFHWHLLLYKYKITKIWPHRVSGEVWNPSNKKNTIKRMQSIEGSLHTSMDSKTAGDNSILLLELSIGFCLFVLRETLMMRYIYHFKRIKFSRILFPLVESKRNILNFYLFFSPNEFSIGEFLAS